MEGIEVYRGEADTPAEFSHALGAVRHVVIWTRRGFRERD